MRRLLVARDAYFDGDERKVACYLPIDFVYEQDVSYFFFKKKLRFNLKIPYILDDPRLSVQRVYECRLDDGHSRDRGTPTHRTWQDSPIIIIFIVLLSYFVFSHFHLSLFPDMNLLNRTIFFF